MNSIPVGAGFRQQLFAYCASDEVRLGGGYRLTDIATKTAAAPLLVYEDSPTDTGQGWQAELGNASFEEVTLNVYVVCAKKAV